MLPSPAGQCLQGVQGAAWSAGSRDLAVLHQNRGFLEGWEVACRDARQNRCRKGSLGTLGLDGESVLSHKGPAPVESTWAFPSSSRPRCLQQRPPFTCPEWGLQGGVSERMGDEKQKVPAAGPASFLLILPRGCRVSRRRIPTVRCLRTPCPGDVALLLLVPISSHGH